MPIKRRRVPNGVWPEVVVEYNARYCENRKMGGLKVSWCKGDARVMAVVAEVIQRRNDETAEAERQAMTMLKKANMLKEDAA